jgi:CHAT domain
MDQLMLEIKRYSATHQWYWSLSDRDGSFITDHEVDVDPAARQFTAFTRLSRYLQLNVANDRPLSGEAEIIDWLGRWMGDNLLGPIGPALAERGPATVEVIFPAGAEVMMFRPWELTIVDGLPLARQDVSLVMTRQTAEQLREKSPVSDQLRMLAVFSLPGDAPALTLREQRAALVRLVNGIQTRHSKAIDLSVLQYDVNRDRLLRKLEEGAGWDIVHFSGHGLVDGLVLEGPDGTQDVVPVAELIRLLRTGRERLKLLVLSSCNSAAAPPREMIAARFEHDVDVEGAAEVGRKRALPVLADEAARRLDCGVLAMRYTVDDDFSIALADHLYSSMLGSDQPLARALQLALPKALGDRPRPGTPALSVGIPALFGRRCLDLSLSPPAGQPDSFDPGRLKMTGFPEEPEHLIGRGAAMGRAARLLGDDARVASDGKVGVMFTGPAGLGKTACAVELAYRNENDFAALAYYDQIAKEGVFGSLKNLASILERQLRGLKMTDEVTSAARLDAFLPRLTELMERNAILIVIDGIDELLTTAGYWRDTFWHKLVDALLNHRGYSRLVLTGRQPPAPLPRGLAVERVEPLSPDESVLLARQLPTLGSLMRGTSRIPMETARPVVASALTAAAGNPDAIRARDEELGELDLAQVAAADTASAEYVTLIGKWTYELG